MKDFYKILGVSKDATQEQIASAYRKLAIKYHPDHNSDSGAVDKFKEAAEAFEILSDPDKKRQYDNPGPRGYSFGSTPFGFDVFNHFFGRQAVSQGFDIEHYLDLTFEEAALGCNKDVAIKIEEPCSVCKGQGIGSWKTCDSCNGTGRKVVRQSPFVMQTICSICKGTGKISDGQCNSCSGKGTSGTREENITVKVPAGIFSGARLRVSGKGGINEHGRGDLIIAINVKEHPFFNRDGCDIICELGVSFSSLVLGGSVSVPTLNGSVLLKIKPGVKDGSRMRLSGAGIVDISNPNRVGDMYVLLKVIVPDDPSEEYKKLVQQLKELEN